MVAFRRPTTIRGPTSGIRSRPYELEIQPRQPSETLWGGVGVFQRQHHQLAFSAMAVDAQVPKILALPLIGLKCGADGGGGCW